MRSERQPTRNGKTNPLTGPRFLKMQFVQKWIVPAVITIVTIELWNRFLKPRLGL